MRSDATHRRCDRTGGWRDRIRRLTLARANQRAPAGIFPRLACPISPAAPPRTHFHSPMQKRKLGRSGLEISTLVLGGNVFGWTADREASFGVLDAYAEAGGNCIDTADGYSIWVPGNKGGESETIIGEWMKRRGNRDRMIIA